MDSLSVVTSLPTFTSFPSGCTCTFCICEVCPWAGVLLPFFQPIDFSLAIPIKWWFHLPPPVGAGRLQIKDFCRMLNFRHIEGHHHHCFLCTNGAICTLFTTVSREIYAMVDICLLFFAFKRCFFSDKKFELQEGSAHAPGPDIYFMQSHS